MRLGLIAFGVAFLLSPLPVDAQVLTGNIIGTVTDESKSVLPGVTATLTSSALQGRPRDGVTDDQGRYRFTNLRPWHLHPHSDAVGIRHLPGGGSPRHHRAARSSEIPC